MSHAFQSFVHFLAPRPAQRWGCIAVGAVILTSTFASAAVGAQEGAASQPAQGAASQPATTSMAASEPSASSQPASTTTHDAAPQTSTTTAPPATSVPASSDSLSMPSPAVWKTLVTAADVTNRPGASETSSVLPAGAILIQTGLDFASSGAVDGNTFAETRSATIPDLTVRVGVLNFLEVRAGAKYVLSTDILNSQTSQGLEGYRLGVHLGVVEESTFIPAMALSLGVDVPLPSFAYDQIGGEARLAMSKGLFDAVGLAANAAAGWDGLSGGTPYVAWTFAVSGALSSSVSPFIETFGSYRPLDGTPPEIWVDGGAQFAATDWLALDAAIGIAAFGAGLSYYTSVGASFLIPGHLMIFGGDQ